MKKWHIIAYRLSNPKGSIDKTIYESRIFSEIESSLLIQNVLTHLLELERERIPIPQSIISLNNDGTETIVENGSIGSKLHNAWIETQKK